ncbi:hypothetical protein CLV59_103413 [Chitinophaga dinghuensis]|uniref:Uncharacterized protein n=1 Tax=Chitinophaga dinghuensis TaxID=1539050 RepID=A0A327W5K5_9BACT|nr:hypothetical protein CLV59_103413 [Chitinophaga dinghuensis]
MLLLLGGCISTAHVQGTYTNVYAEVAGVEFKLCQEPNKFEYYSRTEGSVTDYSSGTWQQDKKSIFLHGFDDKNIKVLNVESKVEDSPNENDDKIVVNYKGNPYDTFIKVDILINGCFHSRITGDTIHSTDKVVRTLQVKSYMMHDGFGFVAPPHIDTLYSPEIVLTNPNNRKRILLKINVAHKDYYRSSFTDTLIVKSKHTLEWRGQKFRKLRD